MMRIKNGDCFELFYLVVLDIESSTNQLKHLEDEFSLKFI